MQNGVKHTNYVFTLAYSTTLIQPWARFKLFRESFLRSAYKGFTFFNIAKLCWNILIAVCFLIILEIKKQIFLLWEILISSPPVYATFFLA